MYPQRPGQAPNMWDRFGNAAGFDTTWGNVQWGGQGQPQGQAPGGMPPQAGQQIRQPFGSPTAGGASAGNPLAGMYGFGGGAMIGGAPQIGGMPGGMGGSNFGMPPSSASPSGGVTRTMPQGGGQSPAPRIGRGQQLPGAGTTGGMPVGVSTPGGGMGGGPPQGNVFQGIAPMMGGGMGGVGLPGAGTTDQGEQVYPGGRRDGSGPRQASASDIARMQKISAANAQYAGYVSPEQMGANDLAANPWSQTPEYWRPQNGMGLPSMLRGGMFSGIG